jgi:hypothetical protein
VESSQVIAQGRKKLPSPNTKKKENENHHSAGPASQAANTKYLREY